MVAAGASLRPDVDPCNKAVRNVLPVVAGAGLKPARRRERDVAANGCCRETRRIVIGSDPDSGAGAASGCATFMTTELMPRAESARRRALFRAPPCQGYAPARCCAPAAIAGVSPLMPMAKLSDRAAPFVTKRWELENRSVAAVVPWYLPLAERDADEQCRDPATFSRPARQVC